MRYNKNTLVGGIILKQEQLVIMCKALAKSNINGSVEALKEVIETYKDVIEKDHVFYDEIAVSLAHSLEKKENELTDISKQKVEFILSFLSKLKDKINGSIIDILAKLDTPETNDLVVRLCSKGFNRSYIIENFKKYIENEKIMKLILTFGEFKGDQLLTIDELFNSLNEEYRLDHIAFFDYLYRKEIYIAFIIKFLLSRKTFEVDVPFLQAVFSSYGRRMTSEETLLRFLLDKLC